MADPILKLGALDLSRSVNLQPDGGFDPADVPEDRHGLRHSIQGRMTRHGGRAEVRSTPGNGTEVRLSMPRHPAQHPPERPHPRHRN